jgi:hypothetical protein
LANVCTGAPEVISDNLPALHDKFHALEFGDIVRRIAGDGDEIRILAVLNGPDSVPPANIFCANRGCGTDSLEGCHPVFNHGYELYGIFSMIGSWLLAVGLQNARKN